ncbi:hypothetical protein XBJ2_760003 [Xenorhabdus bovienii str. Jollieti]|nr:hypothetical protein XBJ2_760003 [Xenorhabdus bovienii str. Jollieti]
MIRCLFLINMLISRHWLTHVDRVAPRIISPKGGRPPFPTEVMVRIIILKHFHNLSDEKMEYQLLDRMSWQRFCRLTDVINIPDRNTIWYFEKRMGRKGPGHCLKKRSISFRHRDSFLEVANSLMPR